jgi:hypothetical protein
MTTKAQGLALCLSTLSLTTPVWAQDPRLSMAITDGNPHDRIYLLNKGRCDIVSGTLTIDFKGSDGNILIDTQYGGKGTKDPMPVEIEKGLIAVDPVPDGAQKITIHLIALPPNGRAIVTLDVDNDQSGWFSRRVSILSEDLNGTTARYTRSKHISKATFGKTGTANLALPKSACDKEGAEDQNLTPIS